MLDVRRVSDTACEGDIIGIVIRADTRHCGIAYPTESGSHELCDLLADKVLKSRPIPTDHYWSPVALRPGEVSAVTAFIERILESHATKALTYSLVYTANAFDVKGAIARGDGLTCATFIVAVFERLSLPLLDSKTWEARPKEDRAFQDEFLRNAIREVDPQRRISPEAAMRIAQEKPNFRIKPAEVCGAAASGKYPVKFNAAITLAKEVVAIIDANEAKRKKTSSA
jgi:hypothetical protein